jgi:hypothetical protein
MKLPGRNPLRTVMFVSLPLASVIALAVGGVARGTTASTSLIAIHEHGTDPVASISRGATGNFTIQLAGSHFGPAGSTYNVPDPALDTHVNGEDQIPFIGRETLSSAKGRIELAYVGTEIMVNSKPLPSGSVVGPAVEYGTWKVKTASGIYRGWKGGGNWAAVIHGYGRVEPYSVEWDGYITR